MTENNAGTPAPTADNANLSKPPDWYNTPPSWLQNAPTNNPTPPAAPSGANRNELRDAINGLPDQIVNAIREAFPPASTQQPTSSNAGNSPAAPTPASTPPAEQEPGKAMSFAEWWWKR